MKRLFILLCYLLVSVGYGWAQNTADEQIDALYDEFSKYEGADGTKLGPVMMKMAVSLLIICLARLRKTRRQKRVLLIPSVSTLPKRQKMICSIR